MIKTRRQIHPLLRRRLGNGETTSFWVDNWSPFGNLQEYLGASTSRFGIPSTATVALLYDQDHWLLPPARSENQLAIQVHLTTVTLIDEQDHYEWEVARKTSSRYSSGAVYTHLKGHVPLRYGQHSQLDLDTNRISEFLKVKRAFAYVHAGAVRVLEGMACVPP
ncbi:hypothetical protein F2Q69_00034170 [Brassica cretica]|uniref:Reverse transcriptase zinc-binding domain-containing protein n=1 Tax=Brassica cretica TaxID=69181 RepID=A0A8S9SNT4_BRACR|nr:hypothetical protein F2Q69_00034170 [Brassica cretica]